uniref:non-specific serine/threonine protein kinase n=1 Tax=Brassica oleracea var. oleracea TaxID=109376 RepID=A0A0D3BEA5_BRAOL
NYVALKIQKSAQRLVQAALHEIELLQAAADGDPANTKCVVRLIDDFKHAGPNGQHLCMVLEFLGDSLLRLIRYNRYKAVELIKVREICKCVLTGLDYLHRELGMIHTDLKPENILLRTTIDPAKDPIRSGLTPLLEKPEGNQNGAATTMNLIEKKLKRRVRRAVAKNIGKEGFDSGFKRNAGEEREENFRARQLFAPKDGNGYGEDEDHLALMMELLGKMPRKIATGGARSEDYFDRHGDLKRIRRLNIGRLNVY